MIRYRCPHCALLTAAHERRVGQASVCKACLKAHQIPMDSALWLTETGEPLHPSAPAAESVTAPAAEREVVHEPQVSVPEPVMEPAPTQPGAIEPEPTLPKAVREPDPVPELVSKLPPVSEPIPEPPAVRAVETRRDEEPEPAFRPARVVPVPAPAALAPEPEEEYEKPSVATLTPPPQQALPIAVTPLPRVRTTPVPQTTNTPQPRHVEPVQLQTQADIAAALTSALTARMKPRAAPRRDLRPSTAIWMLLTGVGVAFFLVSLFSGSNYQWIVLGAGALQIILGYAWIVRLTHLRESRRGLLCAIPIITPYYLTQHKYARLRPLRFVLTGAALVALAFAVPSLMGLTRPLAPKAEPKAPPPDLSTQSKLAQLRAYRARSEYDGLVKTLAVLVKTDPIRSADAHDRAELAAELEGLCKHEDRAVRLEAMSALVSWDLDPNAAKARRVCLDAVRSSSEDERVRALFLLPRWKDAETARAAQSLISRPGRQTNQAKKSLEEIGGTHAETAAIALLKRADDLTVRLVAIDVLVKVGSTAAADELERFALTTDDLGARNGATAAARQIRERLLPAPMNTP